MPDAPRPLARATSLLAMFLFLCLSIPRQVAAEETREIDFSKYDKDALLLVIDQMQKRIKSLERENQLLREKISDAKPSSRPPRRSNVDADAAATASSASAPIRDRQVGQRGRRTPALKKFEYLPDSHRTYVGTGDRPIDTSIRADILLDVSASFEGKEPPDQPRSYTMTITVTSAHHHFTTHHAQKELALFLDDEKVDVGINHYQHWHVAGNHEDKRHNESLMIFIKPDLMQRIADAQSVTVKTAPTSFELDQDLIQAMRDLNDFFAGQ